jgi:hypothetical protein
MHKVAECNSPRNSTACTQMYATAEYSFSDQEKSFSKRFNLNAMPQNDVDLFHRSMCEPEPKLCLLSPSEFKPPTSYFSDRRQHNLSKRTGKPLPA